MGLPAGAGRISQTALSLLITFFGLLFVTSSSAGSSR
jgi:hypothetical protein